MLGVDQIAIIPEPPDNTTGHADGLLMWITDNKLILLKHNHPIDEKILNELNKSFPGVEILQIPDLIPNTQWKDFSSAKNCFVNLVVTDEYIYMPTVNDIYDLQMFELFQSHTNKTVVRVPSENVAMMSGSVRCLSWQIQNDNLLQLIEKRNK